MTTTDHGSPLIEFRVRAVTRYIVTRYQGNSGADNGCREHGEFDNFDTAYAVGYALAKAEHDRLGYPPGDMRVRYPAPREFHYSDCATNNGPAETVGPCDCGAIAPHKA